jgi:hypothetical protein
MLALSSSDERAFFDFCLPLWTKVAGLVSLLLLKVVAPYGNEHLGDFG